MIGKTIRNLQIWVIRGSCCFFTARRYASAVTATSLVYPCPCPCLSQAGISCMETTGRIRLVLLWRLPSTYHTLCYEKFGYRQKRRYFPQELCSKVQTPDFKNFATASRSCCQQNSSTVELVDLHTYDSRGWTHIVYYTSRRVDRIALSPNITALLRSVVDLLYNVFLHL